MQQQWMVNSVEDFWQVIKTLRPKEGKRQEARHRNADARLTLSRVIQVLREVDLCSNWSSAPLVVATLLERVRELKLSRAELAKSSELSAETIKNIVAGKHCPCAAPAFRLAAKVDAGMPDRDPLALVITLPPATSSTRDARPAVAAGGTPPTRGVASPDAAHQSGAAGALDSNIAPPPAFPPPRRRAEPTEPGLREALARCRRRWAAARRRVAEDQRPTAASTQPASLRPRLGAPANAATQIPPESATRRGPREPVAGAPLSQEPPAVSTRPTPSESEAARLSQEPPASSPRRTDSDERTDHRHFQNFRLSPLVDRQRLHQLGPSMHVMKCRFPDGRVMRFEAGSTGELKGLLPRAIPGDDLIHVEIQIDGQAYDPTGLVAMERATEAQARASQAEERATKAEMKAEELERSRMPSIFEHLAHGVFEQLEYMHTKREQKQQKKEKRRHGRKR